MVEINAEIETAEKLQNISSRESYRPHSTLFRTLNPNAKRTDQKTFRKIIYFIFEGVLGLNLATTNGFGSYNC